jgi:hypothetical protein
MITTDPTDDTTTIDIMFPSTTTTTKRKEKKRIVTTTKKWNFSAEELTHQYDIIVALYEKRLPVTATQKFVIQQITQKVSSYKYQDQLKGLYDETAFANSPHYIITLLYRCELNCFYCQNKTQVIYERVCEPSQWTLERIDNNLGHNVDNICIACLKCNIGRRTMHQKRYLFTKKCTGTNVILEDYTPTTYVTDMNIDGEFR